MEIDEEFRCSSCRSLLIEPKFTFCAHRYCNHCLTKLLMSTHPTVCLVKTCNENIQKDQIYPDLPLEKRLNRLKEVVCANKSHGCLWKGPYTSYKEHFGLCPYARLQCDLCSAMFTDRSFYREHLSSCPKALVRCPLNKIGCLAEVRREALADHLTSSIIEHFQRLAEKISTSTISAAAGTTATTLAIESSSNVAEAIEQLRLENQSLRATMAKMQQDLVRTRVDSQLNTGKLCQLSKDLDLTQSFIDHDGTFLWCIENIQQAFYNAKNSEDATYLLSPPFYTSKSGYKLSLKVYLNGDKTVRNSHLSLYVTLMRHDYDSLLQWPFPYPITLCLYDQSPRRDHVVHTLKPDQNSESFQQPRMESNKSGGIPEYCPLWKVFSKEFGYVKGNRMFIKAFVDFHLFPPTIWPLWTKLQSAGLPTEVEHWMLKNLTEEKER